MPFPTDGAGSPVLDELIRGPAAALTAVALVATPAARASGWAAGAAAAVAAGWRGPRSVVLADLDLEQPGLHELAGVPNEEGVVDLIDYGLSLDRLVRRTPDNTFEVLSAGLFALEPGAVLRSDAWERVLGEVAGRRSTLLAYVPLDAEGADAIVRRAGAVLILAEEHEGRAPVERLPHPYAVLAILVPVRARAEPAAEDVAAEASEEVAAPASVEPPLPAPATVAAGVEVEWEAPDPATGEAAVDAEAAVEVEAPVAAEPASDAATGREPGLKDQAAASSPPQVEEPTEAGSGLPGARLSDEEFERIRLPQDRTAREALIAELRDRQRAARLSGEPGGTAATRETVASAPIDRQAMPTSGGLVAREVESESRADGVALETLTPPRRDPPPPSFARYRHALLWTGGVVLLASLLAGAWHFLSGRLPRPAPVAATEDSAVVAAEPEPPAVEDALPFVVAIEAHRDLALAVGRISDLQEIEPELAFHIEPIEREGVLYYHVMGGPVADSAAALALRDTLIARGHKTGRTPTDVRATPLAFLIGDYATIADAREQADVLRRLDIPAYLLPAAAADGGRVYRLYVGGFGGEAEAGAVGQVLRAAGIRDTLVTRTGAVRFGALRPVPDSLNRDSSATGSITP